MPTPPDHRERLTPPWWAWLLAAGWAATLGIAYGHAIGEAVGAVVGAAALALAGLGLWQISSVVLVDARGLRAGRAHLPPWAVGTARVLDREQARRVRGTGADARAFVLLRGWIPTAVTVEVLDESDPTPYWYVSSRRPEQLAAALRALAGSSTTTGEADPTGSHRSGGQGRPDIGSGRP